MLWEKHTDNVSQYGGSTVKDKVECSGWLSQEIIVLSFFFSSALQVLDIASVLAPAAFWGFRLPPEPVA